MVDVDTAVDAVGVLFAENDDNEDDAAVDDVAFVFVTDDRIGDDSLDE